ncbi:hypothetical protein COLO4_10001 [Corchorus olitorius]|uniref:Uncharacterized protein n=1 Tax=Corchorus olitorius TaxID=93759 RepID=A0A1R3KAH2_9ROSI|nr:hypothetical protein COLO4_10001 [Corchorus olitorius]
MGLGDNDQPMMVSIPLPALVLSFTLVALICHAVGWYKGLQEGRQLARAATGDQHQD